MNTKCMGCHKHSELLSLRAQVKRFEDGREIKNLNDELQKKNRKTEDLQKENDRLKGETNLLRQENRSLKQELETVHFNYEDILKAYERLNERMTVLLNNTVSDDLSETMDKLVLDLMKRIEDLEGKYKKLTAQNNRDYTNSSKPSSFDPNHGKIVSNSRIPSGRKPGAQPGSLPKRRKHFTPTEPTVFLIPKEVSEYPDEWEMLDKTRVRQLVDIKMAVTCTEYCAHAFRNRKTKQIIYSAFPDNVVNEMNYGESLKALCCLLTNYCNVSIRKTGELVSNLTDREITISTGTIAGLAKELRTKSESSRNEILNKLMKSPALHSDATGVRINGEKWNIYVTASKSGVMYTLSKKKGIEGIRKTPLKDYIGAVIHDHDKSYYNDEFDFSLHQECLAHILRYLQDSIENEPNLIWAKLMHRHLQCIINRYKEGPIPDNELEDIVRNYEEILRIAEQEYHDHPPTKYYRDGFNLAKRLGEYQEETLAFLMSETVHEYENNLSERLLRICVRKCKAVISFRAESSVEAYCDAMSLIQTAKMNGKNIYSILKEGFSRAKA